MLPLTEPYPDMIVVNKADGALLTTAKVYCLTKPNYNLSILPLTEPRLDMIVVNKADGAFLVTAKV